MPPRFHPIMPIKIFLRRNKWGMDPPFRWRWLLLLFFLPSFSSTSSRGKSVRRACDGSEKISNHEAGGEMDRPDRPVPIPAADAYAVHHGDDQLRKNRSGVWPERPAQPASQSKLYKPYRFLEPGKFHTSINKQHFYQPDGGGTGRTVLVVKWVRPRSGKGQRKNMDPGVLPDGQLPAPRSTGLSP